MRDRLARDDRIADVGHLLTRSAELRARAEAGEPLGLVETCDALSPLCCVIEPLIERIQDRARSRQAAQEIATNFLDVLEQPQGEPLN